VCPAATSREPPRLALPAPQYAASLVTLPLLIGLALRLLLPGAG
jgi:hypothetical protein